MAVCFVALVMVVVEEPLPAEVLAEEFVVFSRGWDARVATPTGRLLAFVATVEVVDVEAMEPAEEGLGGRRAVVEP